MPMFCDCCSGEFCPKALSVLDEPELPPPLLPNIPEEPIDEPPPDMPMPDIPLPLDIPPLDMPPPELPNCAQTDPALTVMPKNINQERFNARHMGISS